LIFSTVSDSKGTNCAGKGVAADDDERADDGTSPEEEIRSKI